MLSHRYPGRSLVLALVLLPFHMAYAAPGAPLTLSISLAASNYHGYNISCNGAQDGWIDLTITGGVAPFQIDWSNKATTEDISGLAAGYYHVTVAAANGERVEEEITLTQPLALTGELTKSLYPNSYNISCFDCFNGTLQVTASGGTTPYAYAWDDGPTTAYRSHLGPMEYKVVVTDANGCTKNQLTTLTQPERSDWTMVGNGGTDPASQYFGTSDNKDLVLKTNATERLRLLAGGGVKLNGLASTTGGYLKVDPSGTLQLFPYTLTGTPIDFWSTTGNWLGESGQWLGTKDLTGLIIKTNNTERMQVSASGRLGVGTNGPETDFHFHHAGAEAKMLVSSTSGGSAIWLRNNTFAYAFSLDESGRGHIMQNYNSPSPLMTFDDGRVAIGDVEIPNHDYALFVEKGILTEKISVKLVENWPDFVFTPEYQLRPLREVEQFIKTHGHLPDVPSAQEAETAGVDLVKSNQMLLQKVEELTLYIIELEKRMRDLENRNGSR
ncbi:MAG: SprB repeat-containing protein [Bacteroidetes bacterium]|nr:SprB repeat-containing protein [Bacteroidota bacterium]